MSDTSMQRVTFSNGRGLTLVGAWSPAASGNVVVLAHGFLSDKTSDGRFDRIARKLGEAGYGTLAFDFSGCGESDDDTLTSAKQEDDLRAAINFVRSQGVRYIALWGHSLGSRVCLRAAPVDISAMVLTGVGPGPMHYRWEEFFSAEALNELETTGHITVGRDAGPRRRITVAAQMLDDFADFDAPLVLGRILCPVLLINGDADEEERQLAALSRQALSYLSPASHHEIIPGASHGFRDHLDRVIEIGLAWLRQHVPDRPTLQQVRALQQP